MYGKVYSCCLLGIDGKIVETEIDIQRGLPQFHIVGLPDSAVRESTERVRAAIRNSGFDFPMQRITVNLAPADIRKEGSAFDLAIALGILLASGQWRPEWSAKTVMLGELSLDGTVRPIPGVLAMVDSAAKAGIGHFILPEDNASEAACVTRGQIAVIRQLRDIAQPLPTFTPNSRKRTDLPQKSLPDFADVRGQQHAKRAITVAAAGMHNILLSGPPGSGKTMLLRRMPGILPELDEQESIQVSKIYSTIRPLAGDDPLVRRRPFRAPHHQMSEYGLVGGGSVPRPGEITLAHKGVLFLDELPEFSRAALESLRQPLEDGEVTISRARATYTFPCRFLLAASMNPCPCGLFGVQDEHESCRCTPTQIARYRNKISAPLIDRIDLQVEVPKLELTAAWATASKEDGLARSEQMREKVQQALERQAFRYRHEKIRYNSELEAAGVARFCKIDAAGETLLRESFQLFRFSARTWHRLLKLARTLADLEAMEEIQTSHLAEALQYRFMDKPLV